jgi:hypothetical protein
VRPERSADEVLAVAVQVVAELELRNEVHRSLHGDIPPAVRLPLSEVLDRMSEDDWAKLAKLAKLLKGRTLAEVLTPYEQAPAADRRPRRRRWVGRHPSSGSE